MDHILCMVKVVGDFFECGKSAAKFRCICRIRRIFPKVTPTVQQVPEKPGMCFEQGGELRMYLRGQGGEKVGG